MANALEIKVNMLSKQVQIELKINIFYISFRTKFDIIAKQLNETSKTVRRKKDVNPFTSRDSDRRQFYTTLKINCW